MTDSRVNVNARELLHAEATRADAAVEETPEAEADPAREAKVLQEGGEEIVRQARACCLDVQQQQHQGPGTTQTAGQPQSLVKVGDVPEHRPTTLKQHMLRGDGRARDRLEHVPNYSRDEAVARANNANRPGILGKEDRASTGVDHLGRLREQVEPIGRARGLGIGELSMHFLRISSDRLGLQE